MSIRGRVSGNGARFGVARGDVGLALALLFLAELDGELNPSALVLAELRFHPPALAFQGLAKLPFLPLPALAQPVRRASGDELRARFELREQIFDIPGGGFEEPAVDRLAGGAGILQGGLQSFQRSRFGLLRIRLERFGAARRLDPAGGDRNEHLVQALGPAPEQAQPPQQHHTWDGIGSLHQTGAGEVVVHEPLGAEPGQQTLREALLQVQVYGVVGEHPGVFEDHRPDGRFPSPLGKLPAGLAGRAQGVEGGGPARMEQTCSSPVTALAGGIGGSIWRKRPDRLAVLGAPLLQRRGAQQFERAGHYIAERLRGEVHPSPRPFEQRAASFDLRLEVLPAFTGGFQLLGRDPLLLPVEVRRLDLPCEVLRVPVADAAAKTAFDVVDHPGQAAELALDRLGLPDQDFQDMVLGALRKHEVVAAHPRGRLQLAVDASVALLDAAGVPGQIEVEEVGAVRLEVQPLAGGVGGEQDT